MIGSNDSITAFRRLEQMIALSKIPTVVIYYGDHQPSIQLEFSDDAIARYGLENIRHITFYRLARNFGEHPILPIEGPYLGIDALFEQGLVFAGLPISPELRLKTTLAGRCPQQQPLLCGEHERSAIRAAILK